MGVRGVAAVAAAIEREGGEAGASPARARCASPQRIQEVTVLTARSPPWTAGVHRPPLGSPPEVAPSIRPSAVAATAHEEDSCSQGHLP